MHPSMPLKPFTKWGLDFVGLVKSKTQHAQWEYIILAIDYYKKGQNSRLRETKLPKRR